MFKVLVLGSGFWVQGSGFKVLGSGFRVLGSPFRVDVIKRLTAGAINL
jgi:hypothetical protein